MKFKLFFLLIFSLLILLTFQNCARDASKKMLSKKLKTGRKLASVINTHHYFRQTEFGEIFVIEAQIRSLSTKPIKHIILDVKVFDKAGKIIAARRHAVSWKHDKRKEKTKKYGNLKRKGWLLPGKINVTEIVFYASQLEPEGPREKRRRTLNKKFKQPRTANFKNVIPDRYTVTVYSAVREGDRKER